MARKKSIATGLCGLRFGALAWHKRLLSLEESEWRLHDFTLRWFTDDSHNFQQDVTRSIETASQPAVADAVTPNRTENAERADVRAI